MSKVKRSSKINLKKADKEQQQPSSTAQKIDEGLQQLSNDKFYKPLPSPIVQDTARNVNELVKN